MFEKEISPDVKKTWTYWIFLGAYLSCIVMFISSYFFLLSKFDVDSPLYELCALLNLPVIIVPPYIMVSKWRDRLDVLRFGGFVILIFECSLFIGSIFYVMIGFSSS